MARSWTDEQIRVIQQRNSNLLVAAAAGSGKTAVMVERILRRVLDDEEPLDIDRIVVVTFTKAAAVQMRERIGAAISEELRTQQNEKRVKRLRSQLALLDNAIICTIDSFCNYILRNYFNTIDLDPAFRIGDEGELTLLMSDVADEVIEEAYSGKDESFIELVDGQLPAKSDAMLSEWIQSLYNFSQSHPYPERWLKECEDWYSMASAEEFEAAPVTRFVIEHIKRILGASLKEHRRVIELLGQPGGIEKYIPAFTKDCELLERACAAHDYEDLRESLNINFERLANAPKECDEELKKYAQDTRKKLKTRIDKLNKELLAWSIQDNLDMIAGMKNSAVAFIRLVLDFTRRFDERKQENNILSFSDVEHLALKVLLDDNGYTYAARELQSLYEEIYIDEYQDSNMVQELILSAVSRGSNMFMVGDIKQSIYSFRQADPGIFLDKYNRYGLNAASGNALICLHKNFRSRANVLYGVNDIFSRIMHENLGGVEYDEDAFLVPGKKFPESSTSDDEQPIYGQLKTELLICDMEDFMENATEDEAELGKRRIEAAAVVKRIHELIDDKSYMVWDEATCNGEGGYRAAKYRDIVILLRSANVSGPEYAEILNNAGIPAICSTAYGYFSAYEVAQVLNFLRVIDNPMQDIPLAGAMRSYFCYLTAQELAEIKGAYPKLDLYSGVLKYISERDAEAHDPNLADKLAKFIELVNSYRDIAAYTPIHELIRDIIYNTGYIVYAASLENGRRRVANLDMLVNKAAEYEKTSFHGLFNFLRYIEKIQKYEIDMGEADVMSENDDVVRIMSIHKSKGLEFPIVFVADMEKKYNFRDAAERVSFHAKYGVAMDYVDTGLRVRKKTFHKRAVAESLRVNAIGEELRVLYVALTRAVEKLILVGAVKDAAKAESEWRARAKAPGDDYGYVYEAVNYLDLAAPAFFATGTGEYEYRLLSYKDIISDNTQDDKGTKKSFADIYREACEKAAVADEKELEKLDARINNVYTYEAAVHLPGKFSVSELKHRKIEESEEEAVHLIQSEKHKPQLSTDERNIGAERGNAYHKIFELLDYSIETDYASIKKFIHGLTLEGKLSDEYEELVNPQKYVAFLNSPLGERMKLAALSGKMYREQQFITGFPAHMVREEYEGCEDTILIQGIIDCYFEEEDGVVIVDYKTDHVDEENAEEILTKRYREQLDLYAGAVSQITGKNVKECIIYSVSVNREIKL